MKKFKYFTQNYKSILCLDGDLQSIEKIKLNLPIIAADGAANKLLNQNITPDVIIGDLDSFRLSETNNLKIAKLGTNIICDTSQDTSDFQKAIQWLDANSLLPSIIFGINGGYIDHIINNINIFSETKCMFIDNSMVGLTINAKSVKELSLPINTKISIIGMPDCRVNSSGLKWELKNTRLRFPGNTSCFNRTIKNEISINAIDGIALILIYLENIIDCGI